MKRLYIAFRLYMLGLRINRLQNRILKLVDKELPLNKGAIVSLDKRLSYFGSKWFILESEYKAL